MSFTKTISVVAALGSIFSVGLASWKISEEIKTGQTDPLEEKIIQLEKQLEETTKNEPVVEVPQPQVIQTPPPTILPPLPPLPPVPEPKPGEFE
jgi:hypothetical protein